MGRIQSHKDKPTMQTRLAIGPRACAVPYSSVVYTVKQQLLNDTEYRLD